MYTISSMRSKYSAPGHQGLPPVFTYTAARAAGISAERLYAYRSQGLIEQIGRGLYRWADAPGLDQDLLEVAYRAPRATLCLLTALARHNLTDAIPDRIDIAIPRGTRIPALRPVMNVHVFAMKTFNLGREKIDIGEGFKVGLYSPERSLVDIIRLRHREGADVAWEALRRWLRRRGTKPATLIELATHFHGAERAVRHALEIVL
jgi:predicted transcriptional regulator of viral defense system